MRIINKKYLLIIIMVGIILTGVIFFKSKEEVKLDSVILKQEVNNKTFAMYKEEDDNNYVLVKDNKFPDMYVLNIEKSKCIDNNGNELNGVLSYENDKVTITSGNTIYCYLYFDKSLGEEIKEKEPNKLSAEIKGAMYRFQGQQNENVENYICFGTSDQNTCKGDTDKYMYRIIGIEAETGRVKVIKKEALNKTINWWDNYDDDIEFPKSNIYKAINGEDFLKNKQYIPNGWEEKIANNVWTYGDMLSDDYLGARQTGEGLYLVETGKKETNWDIYATKDTPGAKQGVVDNENSPYIGDTIYFINESGKWINTFDSKISLMYLHDYHYSVSDDANCQYNEGDYEICRSGWMHLSQNDTILNPYEWTMSRTGWDPGTGLYVGSVVSDPGNTNNWEIDGYHHIRPVFYLASVNQLAGGTGTSEDPFIIK